MKTLSTLNQIRQLTGPFLRSKRTFFTSAVEIRKNTLLEFSKKDKNLSSFLKEFDKTTKSFKFEQYPTGSSSIYSLITLKDAVDLDKKVLNISEIDVIKNQYPWLFNDMYTRVYSVNPITDEVLITQDEKAKQMKNQSEYYDPYVRALKIWSKKRKQVIDKLDDIFNESEAKAIIFSLDTFFYGANDAKTRNEGFASEEDESHYLLNINVNESDQLPLEWLSVFIPDNKKTFIKTFIAGENTGIPLYNYQITGLNVMESLELLEETDCKILSSFTSGMRESMAKE